MLQKEWCPRGLTLSLPPRPVRNWPPIPDAAAAFVFSSGLPFPHASGHSLPAGLTSTTSGKALDGRQAQMDPVHVFKSALNCRLSGRTPKMDRCLSELELASSATRQDVASWLFEAAVEGGRATSEGAKAYELEVSKTIEIVRSALQTALEQASSVPQELFLGALVMHLAVDSSALRDLMLLQYDQRMHLTHVRLELPIRHSIFS